MSNSKPELNLNAEPWHRVPWQIPREMQRSRRFYLRPRPLTTAAILELHGGKLQLITPGKLARYIRKTFTVVPKTDTEFGIAEVALLVMRICADSDGGAPLPRLRRGIEELL